MGDPLTAVRGFYGRSPHCREGAFMGDPLTAVRGFYGGPLTCVKGLLWAVPSRA